MEMMVCLAYVQKLKRSAICSILTFESKSRCEIITTMDIIVFFTSRKWYAVLVVAYSLLKVKVDV